MQQIHTAKAVCICCSEEKEAAASVYEFAFTVKRMTLSSNRSHSTRLSRTLVDHFHCIHHWRSTGRGKRTTRSDLDEIDRSARNHPSQRPTITPEHEVRLRTRTTPTTSPQQVPSFSELQQAQDLGEVELLAEADQQGDSEQMIHEDMGMTDSNQQTEADHQADSEEMIHESMRMTEDSEQVIDSDATKQASMTEVEQQAEVVAKVDQQAEVVAEVEQQQQAEVVAEVEQQAGEVAKVEQQAGEVASEVNQEADVVDQEVDQEADAKKRIGGGSVLVQTGEQQQAGEVAKVEQKEKWSIPLVHSPSRWTGRYQCAREHKLCTCPNGIVRYGQYGRRRTPGGHWRAFRYVPSHIWCNNGVWGDPWRGTSKKIRFFCFCGRPSICSALPYPGSGCGPPGGAAPFPPGGPFGPRGPAGPGRPAGPRGPAPAGPG